MAEMDQLLGHADDNDGIQEYDNPLPVWWQVLFAICVAWAIVYSLQYHVFFNRSQARYYEDEVRAADVKWPKKDAAAVAAAVKDDPKAAASGKDVFTTNCVACHGADMTGGIGPNLTDDEWIHGGEMEDIVRTITNGVPAKGMLAWGPILGDQKIAQVAAYVYAQSHPDGTKAAKTKGSKTAKAKSKKKGKGKKQH